MITVFHKGDAPEILAALTELGYAFSEVVFNDETTASEKIAALLRLNEVGRVDAFGRAMLPTTTIDNQLGRSIIAGDYPETVLGKLPRVLGVHEAQPDGRCTCKTGKGAEIVKAALAPVCPECRSGKHRNCDGVALDEATDEIVECTCPPAFGHAPRDRGGES